MTITDQTVECRPIEETLRTLLTVVDSGISSNKSLREKLIYLEEKLLSGQLHLAVLGQMKRGKSSFINALLGAQVLPTGVLPVTAVITEIRYGPAPAAVIVFSTGNLREPVDLNTLADYITEAGNPGNKKQVASVAIAYPSPFLQSGIILIDTPGIGSTHAHNTQTTERYLEQVDAGIIVLSLDPPITEVESQFVKNLKEDVPKLFFILNKTDMASPDEIDKITKFLENELDRLQIGSPEIFPLSARQGLHEKRQTPVGRVSSGLESFEKRLQTFLCEEKRRVLVRSVAMDGLQIARTLKFAVSIGMRAGAMNAEDLQRKRLALDRLLDQTEIELYDLQVLLRQRSADILGRVERDLTTQVEISVREVQQHMKLFQVQHSKESARAFGDLLEDFLMKEVEMVFRKWRTQEDEEVQTQLDTLSFRFVTQANGILERLEQAAGVLFEIPVEHLTISCPLRVESQLYYKVERVFYSLDSFLLLLPRFLLRPIVLRRMHNNVPRMLDMNAGRIRYDYLERLQSSMNQFERDIRGAITMVSESLKSALQEPGEKGQQNTETLGVLDSLIRDCSCLAR
ncbi:MAG: dynamin family protein [Silvibacterium sp.]